LSGSPRFLVVDGYTEASREELVAGGASMAADLYATMLRRFVANAAIDYLFPSDAGARLPTGVDLAQYDGMAWTGCSLTIFDDDPRVKSQIELCRAAYEAGVPSFGTCWGVQIAVVAAGGECRPNPRGREMGIARKIRLTPEGRAHPLYVGKPGVFDGFISHVDEVVQWPATAQLLASNDFTRVQSVSVTHENGTFWGLQYHPEYDLHEMARLIYCRRTILTELGFFADVAAALAHIDRLEALHADPARADLAWALGVDDDVMNVDVRQCETANWITRLVLPAMRR
jgi:GMP synthase (glutamine-hydrolysing)